MIQAILILSIILIAVSAVGFLWIKSLKKKNKSLEFKLDYAENRIEFYQKNRQAFQAVIDKLMEKKKNAEILKKKINNSDSSDLADILNEL